MRVSEPIGPLAIGLVLCLSVLTLLSLVVQLRRGHLGHCVFSLTIGGCILGMALGPTDRALASVLFFGGVGLFIGMLAFAFLDYRWHTPGTPGIGNPDFVVYTFPWLLVVVAAVVGGLVPGPGEPRVGLDLPLFSIACGMASVVPLARACAFLRRRGQVKK